MTVNFVDAANNTNTAFSSRIPHRLKTFGGEVHRVFTAPRLNFSLTRFVDDILSSSDSNIAPGVTISQDAAESVAVIPDYLAREPGTF